MSIQQPRRFVTTDQGHADVLNGPIDTLYANDQELAAQVENIKKDPAGNGVASKEALENHASNTDLHVTAAKQAVWSAAEGNAKQYTRDYAAPKAHTHPASDLPSASTQARGIVQLDTSVSSGATDRAATPSATKQAYDRANEAYSRADQAFTQAVDFKNKIVGAINGKFGGANPDMSSDQIATVITNAPIVKYAEGTIVRNGDNISVNDGYDIGLPATASVSYTIPVAFTVSKIFVYLLGYAYFHSGGWNGKTMPSGISLVTPSSNGRLSNEVGEFIVSINSSNLLTVTMNMSSGTTTSSTGRYYKLNNIQWWAIG
ncbi:phage tail protein [Paenibacillus polymyxa]|uniref:phage tail protein n=1 Tax=Paenibacillus polymyxa TaxID=1406 RepID=UPI0032AFD0A6